MAARASAILAFDNLVRALAGSRAASDRELVRKYARDIPTDAFDR